MVNLRRRRSVILVGGLCLASSACSSPARPVSAPTTLANAAERSAAESAELRPADLPGWEELPSPPSTPAPLWEELGACAGGPGADAGQTLALSSPQFVQGATEVGGDVTVLDAATMADAKLRAVSAPKIGRCAASVVTPVVAATLPTGAVVSDVQAVPQTLPAGVGHDFGWRVTMAITVPGQGSVMVVEDLVGAIVGRMEVDVAVTRSDGAVPDPTLERRLFDAEVHRAQHTGL